MFCFWIHNNQRILRAISLIIFRKYCHKDLQKCRANSSLSEMEKYKRENNQPKHRHGLQMNHYKDSSLSSEYANSCEVILLWFCSDDHENWLSADNHLLEYQTKFNDKNIWFKNCFPCEISFALSHAFCNRTLILHTAE